MDNSIPSKNTITGLLQFSDHGLPTCDGTIGNNSAGFFQRIIVNSARGTSLRVDCPAADSMALRNMGGCLQVVWAKARTIYIQGDRSVVIHPDTRSPPRRIDVGLMTNGDPASTRIIIRLNQWQRVQPYNLVVEGRLGFAVPRGKFAVFVHGCGTSTVRCTATDRYNTPTCRLIERCVSRASDATRAMLAVINGPNPCEQPDE